MPDWITTQLGTASYYDLGADILSPDIVIVDVRELVDKEGNPDDLILDKISLVTNAIGQGWRVLVCCDKGISRSNAIALGALLSDGMPYDEAMRLFYAQGLKDMNMALLHQIKRLCPQFFIRTDYPSKEGVLITGGSGFIGRHLLERLRRTDLTVYSPYHQELDLVTNLPELDAYINKYHIKTIIHLAHPRHRNNIGSLGEATQMMKNILEACRLNNCHIHFISSLAVYSGYISEQPLVVNSLKPLPKGTYGETKYLCEELIANYGLVHKTKATILRPSTVYGPGQDQATFMEKFLSFADSEAEIVTHEYKNGRPTFDFLYVDDLVDAI
jgi:dTDP-4-dehydrorhamnose reductase